MDKEEFKRLERAENKSYKKRSKQALYDWGIQFEETISERLRIEYENKFKKELEYSIECFIVAIMYALHFSETTNFGAKRLKNIMTDIESTVDMFYRGEYSPDEYKEILAKDNIFLENITKERIEDEK